jgi:hypothetical protein
LNDPVEGFKDLVWNGDKLPQALSSLSNRGCFPLLFRRGCIRSGYAQNHSLHCPRRTTRRTDPSNV